MLNLAIIFCAVGSFFAASFVPVREIQVPLVHLEQTNYTTQQEATGDEAEFSKSSFAGCRATAYANGGAIYSLTQTKLYVEECTFTNCTTDQLGGAIYFKSEATSKLNLDDSFFRFCIALHGGAVYASGMLSLKTNVFTNCNASGNGSHLYIADITVESKVKETKFTDGTASSISRDTYGGAVYVNSVHNELKFSSCDFSGNTARYGGAIAFGNAQNQSIRPVSILFEYTNFSSNTAITELLNKANDIYAEVAWQHILKASCFDESKSWSDLPMVYVENLGDKSDWLGGNIDIPRLLWWIYAAIVAGVFIVVFLPAIICCCFCCGCACFAASQANRKQTTYVAPAVVYQAQAPQGSLYAPGVPQKY